MSDPISSGGIIWGSKYIFVTYIFPAFAILGGAIAHVLEEIRVQGWKGWLPAISSGFVAFFAGTLVYSFALHFYPDYAGGIAGVGGFLGTKSITILIKIIKLTTKEL